MPDPLDPEKFHILTNAKRRLLMILLCIVVVFILPAGGYFYYNFALSRPSQLDKSLNFEIKKGSSVTTISTDLFKNGAINSDFLFNVYVVSNGFDKNIQAGLYNIQPGTSIKDLVQLFQHGVTDKRITFLEGWRVEEYAREASRVFPNIDFDDFVTKAKPYEGMLFPDTYYFREDVEEDEIVQSLRSTFDDKTKTILSPDAISKTGMTKQQILTFASIVEREVSKPEDRPVVAGILIKRWREGMKIDADATTQYAVADSKLCGGTAVSTCAVKAEDIYKFNWWDQNLNQQDLECDSQYNTRKYVGLPPAPISSAGLSAIDAVINNVQTNYYFYLTDKQGITRYATTIDQHNQNVAKYLNY